MPKRRLKSSWDQFRKSQKGNGKSKQEVAKEYREYMNGPNADISKIELKRERISVWWPNKKRYFHGTLKCRKDYWFLVEYDDDTVAWEVLLDDEYILSQ